MKSAEFIIKEQCADSSPVDITVKLLTDGGKLWIGAKSYGDKCSADGEGLPIGIEIWQGRLRLIVFNDINIEDPMIIDLENAKETARRH